MSSVGAVLWELFAAVPALTWHLSCPAHCHPSVVPPFLSGITSASVCVVSLDFGLLALSFPPRLPLLLPIHPFHQDPSHFIWLAFGHTCMRTLLPLTTRVS